MNILGGTEPERVFYYFERICEIPHGSGNTRAISDFCVRFAREHGLRFHQDGLNNVVIYKPASEGYGGHPPIIIQGHLDMVCEQDPDSNRDMESEGIELAVEDGWITARGTTLGGDDGIAVAMALAILEDGSLSHPPIEAVFTTDEETGMYGAAGIDGSLLSGRRLLNLDSECEGVFTAGCAGGARACVMLPAKMGDGGRGFAVTVGGLAGGHSGCDIDKGRLNAGKVAAQFLRELKGRADFRLAELDGGGKDNVILRECRLGIVTDAEADALSKFAAEFADSVRADTDPGLFISVEPTDFPAALTENSTSAAVSLMNALPNGIISMSGEIDGLVQTSLNLGSVTLGDGLSAVFCVRSSVDDEKRALIKELERTAARFGAALTLSGDYPAWEFRRESELRSAMREVYAEQYCAEPKTEVIHAGLECGLLCGKLPGLDAVSIGPDIKDIHTTRERMSIASCGRVYRFVTELLHRL